MNSYHLEAAIKQIIRQTCIKFYDKRFQAGYVRTPPLWYSQNQIKQTLDNNTNYLILLNEAIKRTEKPSIIEIFNKLVDVIASCKTIEHRIYAQRYYLLAYKMYPEHRLLRQLSKHLYKN